MYASNLVSSVCKKIIKPYFPTPTSLRCHKLSYLDQMVGGIYEPFAFLYPKMSDTWSDKPSNVISEHLENSLSKVLSHYYPFAGKLNENISVDCNDRGVEFFTTKIDCPMAKILKDPYSDKEDLVYPKGIPCTYSYEGSLAVVQLSYFNCGGIAVSVCLTHKIGDGYTIANFIRDWATIARNPSSKIQSPQFNAASIYPPTKDMANLPEVVPKGEECSSKSFTFSSSKLAALRDMVISNSEVQNPTTTEIVSAFIYLRAMATKKKTSGSICPSALVHAVSLRPPLPKTLMGNIGSFFSILTTEEKEMDLPKVVGKLRAAKEELRQKYKNAKTDEFLPITIELYKEANNSFFNNSCYDIYRFSSISKFPIYDIDFGWGKPEKVSFVSNGPVKNMFLLIDNKSRDGMEVITYMKEQDMSAFERDEELLEFTSPSN
ncbi:PREDICTED: acylsugar acyltransferase 3-like [Nicotiana attenuata]|uniref:Acylsugar acyltransferase 3 n=1 Tax=Nicotiana attenuata TaxID=49451 RepID=A0A1J6JQ68_NICAT|nr:PREDICTED: acylsugar acyltransferase 3-like [Nicotiana attenuata]OIT19390.1 acylsugar acyltransferase 3 [Nicotiana attenuata]